MQVAGASRARAASHKWEDELPPCAHQLGAPGFATTSTVQCVEKDMKNLIVRFVREEEGQDLIEYSLLAALIAVACIIAMQALAVDINGIFARIGAALAAA